MNEKLSEYEETAKQQIWAWKTPEQTWFDKTMEIISWPVDKAGEKLLNTPGIGPAIQKAASGSLSVINNVSQWSVKPQNIMAEYEKFTGEKIDDLYSIQRLDLEIVDRVIGWLDAKYEGIALIEGAAAGGTGVLTPAAALAAMPVDVIALLTLNLRAVGEYATYCGFDVSGQEERLFCLNVLALASSPTDSAKQIALAQLVRIARDVALRKTWVNLEKRAFVRVVQQIAKALAIRLTKAKLAQVIPFAGAFIGGGFNAYYTNKVCDAAFYLYRERFLAEKYGPEIIELAVEPAETIEPEYEIEP